MGIKRPVFEDGGRASALLVLLVRREDRSVLVIGNGGVEPGPDGRLGGLGRVAAALHRDASFPQPDVRRMPSMTSAWSMSATMRISCWQWGHRSRSASQTFLMSSRHFLEGMRRGLSP